MNLTSSNFTYFRKLSIWIISVYFIANILIYLSGEYLEGSINEWVYNNINLFLGLFIVGLVIMSLINSIQIIRKTDYKRNIKWLVISFLPFILFLASLIVVLTDWEI